MLNEAPYLDNLIKPRRKPMGLRRSCFLSDFPGLIRTCVTQLCCLIQFHARKKKCVQTVGGEEEGDRSSPKAWGY